MVPRPVFQHGLVYVCSGYPQPELLAVRVDGSGDVTQTHVAWRYGKQVPHISSPILVGNEIYFVSSMGIATCLDSQSGERRWQQRLRGRFSASPLFADGKLYFTNEQGVTTVLRPGHEFQRLARNQLFGETRASIAVAGESLLIRTAPALYCIKKPVLNQED